MFSHYCQVFKHCFKYVIDVNILKNHVLNYLSLKKIAFYEQIDLEEIDLEQIIDFFWDQLISHNLISLKLSFFI